MIFASRVAQLLFPQEGSMNTNLFIQWIYPFNYSITYPTKIPSVLVFDVYASHYNDGIIKKNILK